MDSPCESENSMDGIGIVGMLPPSPISREQLQKRIESLNQQNRVLKVELETYKIRVKVLQEENRTLRQASVIIVSISQVKSKRKLLLLCSFTASKGRAGGGIYFEYAVEENPGAQEGKGESGSSL
jgi:Uncharacterized conserved protein H4 (DUF2046)